MTSTVRRTLGLLALAPLLTLACASSGSGDGGPAGDGGLPDICNDKASAVMDPECQLQLLDQSLDGGLGGGDGGVGQLFYINKIGKQLWLWIQLPQQLPPHALFQLVAGYGVPSTPVDLAVNLLPPMGASLGLAVDNHGTGAPKPIQFLIPLQSSLAGQVLVAQFTDAQDTHDDVHNPFVAYAALIADPDPNVGTVPIDLSASANDTQTGSCNGGPCTGVISVPGRTDTFQVTIPSGLTRPILYLSLTAPVSQLMPPPAKYLLGYELYDPNGNLVISDHAMNAYEDVALSTARLIPAASAGGAYLIKVLAYTPPGGTTPPGDLRLTYTLKTELLPDLDTNEPNDGLPQATPVVFAGGDLDGAGKTLHGRLAFVPDDDWFGVQIPSTGKATRLHYKLTPTTTPSGNSGRFPAVGIPPERLIQLTQIIPDQGTSPGSQICLSDPTSCPMDPELALGSPQQQLVQELCNGGPFGDAGALCLLSSRQEFDGFSALANFEGSIQIPPQGQSATYYLDFNSTGGAYADDLDYLVTFDWQSEGPENTNGYHASIQTALPFGTLGASSSMVSGKLTTGYGYLAAYDLTEVPPVDVRSSSDYDAVPSTADTYEVDFPAGAFAANPYGATWELGWSVTGPGGKPAEGLLLEVQFCDGLLSTSTCHVVTGSSSIDGVPGAIAYEQQGGYLTWYNGPTGSYTNGIFGTVLEQLPLSDGYSVTAEPVGCFCFEPRFLSYGKFYVTVAGADRVAWTDTDYTLSMGIQAYPQTFTLDAGLSYPCPTAFSLTDAGVKIPDSGCEFISRQQ